MAKLLSRGFEMSNNTQEELARIKSAWADNRDIIQRNNQHLENDPWLRKQIIFWMESTRFLITELEIWDGLGNDKKCKQTALRAQKALDILDNLLQELD